MFEYNHTDWNTVYKLGGEQAVKNLQASTLFELRDLSDFATEEAGKIGVPVRSDISGLTTPTPGSGASSGQSQISSDAVITGTLAVEPFKFTSDGGTYSVTTNTAGQIVGTKDGQAWQTWGMPANNIPSTSGELAALLASFQANDAAAASSVVSTANTAAAKVDLSA
jgi:hypothetical protein